MGLCPLKCAFGRNSGIVGLLWRFQMAGYMGQLGLACSWIPRREIEPQLVVAPSVTSAKKAQEDLEKVSKKLIQQIKKQKKLKDKRIPQQ